MCSSSYIMAVLNRFVTLVLIHLISVFKDVDSICHWGTLICSLDLILFTLFESCVCDEELCVHFHKEGSMVFSFGVKLILNRFYSFLKTVYLHLLAPLIIGRLGFSAGGFKVKKARLKSIWWISFILIETLMEPNIKACENIKETFWIIGFRLLVAKASWVSPFFCFRSLKNEELSIGSLHLPLHLFTERFVFPFVYMLLCSWNTSVIKCFYLRHMHINHK